LATIFNPSGVRKKESERVVKEDNATYSFPDAYSGRFEFFKDRPIKIQGDDLDVSRDSGFGSPSLSDKR
jgi:hypothetical protein